MKSRGDLRRERIKFLYEAIKDVQSSIRSLDIKANILLIFSGIFIKIAIDNFIDNLPVFAVLIILLMLSIILIFSALFPRTNLADKVNTDRRRVYGIFYPITVSNSLEEFDKVFAKMRLDDLINELEFELLKLVKILDVKTSKVKKAVYSILVFIFLVLILTIAKKYLPSYYYYIHDWFMSYFVTVIGSKL